MNNGAPLFYTSGRSAPRPAALLNGGVLALAVFAILTFLLGHGGTRLALLIGSHEPSRSHLLGIPSSADPAPLGTEIRVKPERDDDPLEKLAAGYFRVILVLGALDADHDRVISADEIDSASATLRTLDRNRDDRISADECRAHAAGAPPPNPLFMRFHPVLAALDADRDGEISAAEIRTAAAALKTLDKNGDGRLTADEVLPSPLTTAVALFMAALDRNGDGRISADERAAAEARGYRALLDAADLNRDGIVTEDELAAEIWRRADLNGDGVVTGEELRIASQSGALGR
jgi:Ca2+-binding EF-hand superfamily protein